MARVKPRKVVRNENPTVLDSTYSSFKAPVEDSKDDSKNSLDLSSIESATWEKKTNYFIAPVNVGPITFPGRCWGKKIIPGTSIKMLSVSHLTDRVHDFSRIRDAILTFSNRHSSIIGSGDPDEFGNALVAFGKNFLFTQENGSGYSNTSYEVNGFTQYIKNHKKVSESVYFDSFHSQHDVLVTFVVTNLILSIKSDGSFVLRANVVAKTVEHVE